MELEILKNAITRVLQVYPAEILPESTFVGDLGADSLDMLQIARLVEKEMNVRFKESDFDRIDTVNDALMIIGELRSV